ncbi:MAG: ABC transporter permease [Acidobacteria bacterium]|nr:ABC transporter permease [Acidobacteriota bacterium]MBV9624872.1 ABC transporter permease [Acidobacteriota bacterium]
MLLGDLIRDVFRTLWSHKLRTFLTMFGIGWGVVSIVLMVGAGEGLRKGQQDQARNLGKDIMIVFHGRTSLQAGGTRAGRLVRWDDDDVQALGSQAPDCQYALPELEESDVRTHSNYNNASFLVTGSYPEFGDIRSLTVGQGRFYDWDDENNSRRVAFLGTDAAKQLFPEGRNPLGENIYLNDIPYLVIGVMAKKKQDSSYDGWDVNKVFVPFAAMRRDFPDKPPGTAHTFDQLLVTPRSVQQHEACKHELRVVLAKMHQYDPTDKEACPIWDTIQEAKAFTEMTDGMKYFLGAVGFVTLFLGGIGVMNVMMVAVRERTREIGVRKAVGAPARAILQQFFIEALIIALVSGGVGMSAAYGLCALVNLLPMPDFFAGLLPTWKSGLLAATLLGGIAVFSALVPARRAASVDPIEALRFEAGG